MELKSKIHPQKEAICLYFRATKGVDMIRFVSVFALFSLLSVLQPATVFGQDTTPSDSMVRIKEVILATDIDAGEPVNPQKQFSMADRYAFCFVRYENYGLANTLRFKWYYNDNLLFNFEAKTQSGKGLKTYSVATLQPGNWKIDIIAPGGAILKTLKFKVTP